MADDFVPGLEGIIAFETEIAEPDKDGGALRYRGVDIEDLVAKRVTFGDVWGLLVDGRFGGGLPLGGVALGALVAKGVPFGDVWGLLVDGRFGRGLPPAEPFPLPIHSGD